MNELIPYIPAVLVFGVLLKLNSDMQKRPTFNHLDNDYRRKEVCDEIHKSVDMRLERIETGINKLLFKNGI